MCAIAGILNLHGRPVTEEQIRPMAEAQQHRGPDNLGIRVQENVGFAHNRLSILDLSPNGNQPFWDERHMLIYNGEIYNYRELAGVLQTEGLQIHGTSDTAVLFSALVHWGVEPTLKRIRGMFAFAFASFTDGAVYLCRDRLGIKPLHWAQRQGAYYWASEVKALKAVAVIEPDPVRTLFGAASIADHATENTVFAGVHHVTPGTYLRLDMRADHADVRQYYDILADIDEARYRELDKRGKCGVLEEFDALFGRSVKSMLMSDAPMGVFVSGGIDSGLIAATALPHNRALDLFTANVEGRMSEIDDARAVAAHLQRPLHVASFQPAMMVQDWALATYHYEAPVVTHTNALPFARVAQKARCEHVKAVLTGEGADELFLGYPRLLTQPYRDALLLPVRAYQALCGCIPRLRKLLFPEAEPSIEGFLSLVAQGFERQRLRERGFQAYGFLDEGLQKEQYLSIQMLREHLVSLLHRNDRMGMKASIESRFPFLDEEIVKFAINLPTRYKAVWARRCHDVKHPFRVDKWPVRALAQRQLPQRIVHKRKDGFPMFGHQYVSAKPGFFRGGYVEQIVGLRANAEDYLLRTQPPYFVAKLISVDVFGRLFAKGESCDGVSERLMAYTSVTPR